MTSTATHALRNKWFVSFLPLLTADMVTMEFKGDWKVAAQQKMQRLDWVTTVEEVWSTMNSLPRIQQLGVGTTFIFAREDKEPSFETFPNGSRLVVKLFKAPATDKGLETIIAVVLGETVTEEATGGVPVCDVIRIAARPSREYSDTVRVEVWLNDASYSGKVADYLKVAFRDRSVPSNQYSIEENPFETGSPASSKPIKTPLGASPPQLNTENDNAKRDRGGSQEKDEQEEGFGQYAMPAESAPQEDKRGNTGGSRDGKATDTMQEGKPAPEEGQKAAEEEAATAGGGVDAP